MGNTIAEEVNRSHFSELGKLEEYSEKMNIKPPHSFVTIGSGRTRHIAGGPPAYRYILCDRTGKMKPAKGKGGICKKCLTQYKENEE